MNIYAECGVLAMKELYRWKAEGWIDKNGARYVKIVYDPDYLLFR